jgi:hypothetical protein
MYTYVLKDLVQGIYKIGKTKDPSKRLNALCTYGRVVPIALVEKDVEALLHEKFADTRIVNEEAQGGRTEWFKRGGKIDKFLDKIDTGKSIPYITPARAVNIMIEGGNLFYRDRAVAWEVDQIETGKFYIGIEVLYRAGLLKATKPKIISNDTSKVTTYREVIAISEEALRNVMNEYEVSIFSDCTPIAEIDNPTNAPIKRVMLDYICTVLIMVTKKQ